MAERDLDTLLRTLRVKRREGVWQFESRPYLLTPAQMLETYDPADIAMLFREGEGVTLVRRAGETTAPDNRWIWLELSVYSDLQAVGFLAAVAAALAKAGVPCNAVAAFHHDHIFVPEGIADTAIGALDGLSQAS